MITILAIGKKHEDWVTPGIERYQKRLQKPFDVKWVLLPHSSSEGMSARQSESEALLKRLEPSSFVILLDETGKNLSTPELTSLLDRSFTNARPITIIIGGAFGVDERLKQRADVVWSLSRLVFPHQLVRLILIEQLYRAQEIVNGGKYHHE